MGKRKLSAVKMMVGQGWRRRRREQGVNLPEISVLHTRLQLKLNLGGGGTSVLFGRFQPLLLRPKPSPDVGATTHTSYLPGRRWRGGEEDTHTHTGRGRKQGMDLQVSLLFPNNSGGL